MALQHQECVGTITQLAAAIADAHPSLSIRSTASILIRLDDLKQYLDLKQHIPTIELKNCIQKLLVVGATMRAGTIYREQGDPLRSPSRIQLRNIPVQTSFDAYVTWFHKQGDPRFKAEKKVPLEDSDRVVLKIVLDRLLILFLGGKDGTFVVPELSPIVWPIASEFAMETQDANVAQFFHSPGRVLNPAIPHHHKGCILFQKSVPRTDKTGVHSSSSDGDGDGEDEDESESETLDTEKKEKNSEKRFMCWYLL